jgi:hypothetical protein
MLQKIAGFFSIKAKKAPVMGVEGQRKVAPGVD